MALPLKYSRITNLLPDYEIVRLLEVIKGKPVSSYEGNRRPYFIEKIMQRLSKFARIPNSRLFEDILYNSVLRTAEFLELGKEVELRKLSNEEICEKILIAINAQDYEHIFHLSEEERIQKLRAITPKPNVSPIEYQPYQKSKTYHPSSVVPGLLFRFASPKVDDLVNAIKQRNGVHLIDRQIASALGGKLNPADQWKGDINQWWREIKKRLAWLAPIALKLLRIVLVVIAVLSVVLIIFVIVAFIVEAIQEKEKAENFKMIEVVTELVACLCFDPYKVLGLNINSSDESIRSTYVSELYKVHPDRIVGQSAEQQTLAYQRMKELRRAWEIIQIEKGLASPL
ncbi:MAG: J domain-containing protein [Anaerolineales bacterium]|nr:J domain-containing protein [Anaerolineales bacterium]